MKIVVDIPKITYENLAKIANEGREPLGYAERIILRGTPLPKWIPTSERLPEEFICDDGYVEPSDYVLVLGDHGNYDVSRYWGNRKSKIEYPNSYNDWMDLDWIVQPIAWMPLPEPYKAESEV